MHDLFEVPVLRVECNSQTMADTMPATHRLHGKCPAHPCDFSVEVPTGGVSKDDPWMQWYAYRELFTVTEDEKMRAEAFSTMLSFVTQECPPYATDKLPRRIDYIGGSDRTLASALLRCPPFWVLVAMVIGLVLMASI